MPTYLVSVTDGLLSDDAKANIAREITRAHSQATGAQTFFAQVMFSAISRGAHFMGGKRIDTNQIFVHGHIRAGRTPEQKARLLADIVESLHRISKLEKRFLWVYLSELPPANMIEYGQVLPRPGTEQQWLDGLPEADRAYLLGLAGAQD
ncbi:tautomerase family protein [Caballeronia sp. GAFFF2]|jgi:phenylpyruvate tautomerase PptA (4-oxalocrotonate tautomerase family)|uniref:tautomerase family protein n=1 Tax=Caballeronia sp. GAFFF2 TaxID=2921741 RepID=UPI002028B4FB|nr:tautomerase family protein [Caballeronia sp. GAFFF2]